MIDKTRMFMPLLAVMLILPVTAHAESDWWYAKENDCFQSLDSPAQSERNFAAAGYKYSVEDTRDAAGAVVSVTLKVTVLGMVDMAEYFFHTEDECRAALPSIFPPVPVPATPPEYE